MGMQLLNRLEAHPIDWPLDNGRHVPQGTRREEQIARKELLDLVSIRNLYKSSRWITGVGYEKN